MSNYTRSNNLSQPSTLQSNTLLSAEIVIRFDTGTCTCVQNVTLSLGNIKVTKVYRSLVMVEMIYFVKGRAITFVEVQFVAYGDTADECGYFCECWCLE